MIQHEARLFVRSSDGESFVTPSQGIESGIRRLSFSIPIDSNLSALERFNAVKEALQDHRLEEDSPLHNFAPQQFIGTEAKVLVPDAMSRSLAAHGYLAQVWPGKTRTSGEIYPHDQISETFDAEKVYIDPIDRALAAKALRTLHRITV